MILSVTAPAWAGWLAGWLSSPQLNSVCQVGRQNRLQWLVVHISSTQQRGKVKRNCRQMCEWLLRIKDTALIINRLGGVT